MAELLVKHHQNAFDSRFQSNFFDTIAPTYGLVNGLSSLGLERSLRKSLLAGFSGDYKPINVVDFMCGRGENWSHIRSVYPNAFITGVDISEQMLRHTKPYEGDSTIHGSITEVPLYDGCADVITSSFGLKLLNEQQTNELCAEVSRLLHEKGRFVFIELNIHGKRIIQRIARWYFKRVVPLFGGALAKQRMHYTMLHKYCEAFDPQRIDRTLEQCQGLNYTKSVHWFGLILRYKGSKA